MLKESIAATTANGQRATGAQEVDRGTPIDFIRTRPDPTEFPNRLHGKLFFLKNGDYWACSASAINTPHGSVILTAGHCVASNGRYTKKLLFSPAYNRKQSATYGTYAAEKIAAPPQWMKGDENYYYDFAVAQLYTGSTSLEEVLGGSRGIAFNQLYGGSVSSYGYPQDAPFNGKFLWRCDSTYRDPGNVIKHKGPYPFAMGCDMTGGASGGGWVAADNVISVNSFKVTGVPRWKNVMFGPYLGPEAVAAYEAVCCS